MGRLEGADGGGGGDWRSRVNGDDYERGGRVFGEGREGGRVRVRGGTDGSNDCAGGAEEVGFG